MSAATDERVERPAGDFAAAVTFTAEQLIEQRAIEQRLREEREDLAEELTGLQERAGVDLLDNPDQVDEVVSRTATLQVRIPVLDKTIEAQEPRVRAAEAAYLTAEADALGVEVDIAQSRLNEHQAKVGVLLAQLEDLEGEFVAKSVHVEALSFAGFNTEGYRVPKSRALVDAVTRAQTRVEVLRVMAAGGDPQQVVAPILADQVFNDVDPADYYPPCVWRPGALVPAPVLRNRLRAAKRWLTELEALAETLPADVTRLRRTLPSTPHTVGSDPAAEPGIERLQARIADLPAEIDAARAAVDDAAAAID